MGFKKTTLILFSDFELIRIFIKLPPHEITWCSHLPAVLLVIHMAFGWTADSPEIDCFPHCLHHTDSMCVCEAPHSAHCDTRGVTILYSSQFRKSNPPVGSWHLSFTSATFISAAVTVGRNVFNQHSVSNPSGLRAIRFAIFLVPDIQK